MTTLAELSARHPVTITVVEEGQTLAEALAQATGLRAADAELVARRGGLWLGRRRLLDLAWQPPPGTELAVHTPPGCGYGELELTEDDLLYEDDWLLALNKQPGWFPVATPWDVEANVEAALRRLQARRGQDPAALHLAHRLDRDTSGVMLVSKRPEINGALQRLFAGDAVAKRYLALAGGALARDEVELRTGHGRGESGLFRLYDEALIGQRLGPERRPIREARTSFRVIERLPGATLVEARLHTGRTHQIRLHLAALGHPIAGDRRYRGPLVVAGLELGHQLLHAAHLALPHPATGAPLELAAPPPPAFAQALERLRSELSADYGIGFSGHSRY